MHVVKEARSMTIPATEPIERRSLPEVTYNLVRDAILDGHCTPGETLNVDDIVRAVGCSVSPVHLGLDRLLRDGLLERRWKLHVINPSHADGRAAAEALQWFARRLTDDTRDADTAISAIRALDAAGGRTPFDHARAAYVDLCARASNQVIAGMVLQHLDALIYQAQHASPVVSLAAAA
jgi:DNA-binding GntR family transcriptional regulator